MDPERMAELLRDHPEEIARFAREHLDAADTLYHGVLEAVNEDDPCSHQERYFAAIVAAAITILTEAPDPSARRRVQSTANLLLQAHGIPINDETLRAEAAASAKDLDPAAVHRVINLILNPDHEG